MWKMGDFSYQRIWVYSMYVCVFFFTILFFAIVLAEPSPSTEYLFSVPQTILRINHTPFPIFRTFYKTLLLGIFMSHY